MNVGATPVGRHGTQLGFIQKDIDVVSGFHDLFPTKIRHGKFNGIFCVLRNRIVKKRLFPCQCGTQEESGVHQNPVRKTVDVDKIFVQPRKQPSVTPNHRLRQRRQQKRIHFRFCERKFIGDPPISFNDQIVSIHFFWMWRKSF